MTCLSCKTGDMKESTTTYFMELNNCMVIVKRVPCMKCSQCGDEYFSSSVAEKLDELMDEALKITSELLILEYDDNKVA